MATFLDVINDAMDEIGARAAGETLEAAIAAAALSRLNDIIELWNLKRPAIYCKQIASVTITANLQPHTIGLSADSPTWTVTIARPVEIEEAAVLSGTTRIPLIIRDQNWWARLTNPTQTATIPSDLYFRPGWPKGSVYLWPVPSTAATIELHIATLISGGATTGTTFTLPLGYKRALTLTLAEDLCSMFGKAVPADTERKGREARAEIFSRNRQVPYMSSDVAVGGNSGSWDIDTGTYR